jgi:hypothetical protein
MSSFLIALRETFEYGIMLLLLAGVFKRHVKVILYAAIIIAVTGIITTLINYPLSDLLEKVYVGFAFYGFVMLLLLSFVSNDHVIYPILAVVVIIFFPVAQLAVVVSDRVALKGSSVIVYAGLGGFIGIGSFVYAVRYANKLDFRKYVGTDGIFVVIAAFCFMFGGLHEFDHQSVVTSLQHGFHVFFVSATDVLKKLLLVPDGTLIVTPFNDFFELFSSQRVALAATALVLFIPPLFVFTRLMLIPEPETGDVAKRSERRIMIGVYRDELLKKGAPLLVSLAISVVILHSANLAMRPTYEPEPIPIVSEGDKIEISLIDKFGDISDGKMRKYTFSRDGKSYRFMVIMRPDGEVVAVLDACKICPPKGYVQRADHVICKYCNTPIPARSLGQPGGCNPIPLNYRAEGDQLVVSKQDIIDAFQEAGKETGSVLR